MATGCVSEKLVFCVLIPHLVLEDVLDLIVSQLSPDVFIDRQSNTKYKPDLDQPHIKHMYQTFNYAYVI